MRKLGYRFLSGALCSALLLGSAAEISAVQAGPYVTQCRADGKTAAHCDCAEQVLQQQLPAADMDFLQKIAALENSGQASTATFQQLLTDSGRTEAQIGVLLQRVEAMSPLIVKACAR